MIRFKYVVDARTGDKYMVTAVKLADGCCFISPDDSKKEGEYVIDLLSSGTDTWIYNNVPLLISMDADTEAETIYMAHDWENPHKWTEDGTIACAMDEVIASGCVLLFPDI